MEVQCMSDYTKSYNLNSSEQDQSIDEDRICSILDCEAPATHHIETQGYDETISFALCRNCSRTWEDDSK